LVRLDDAVNEFKKYDAQVQEKNKKLGSQTVMGGPNIKMEITPSYITNDPGFYETLKTLNDKREGSSEQIKQIMMDRLPQINQFGMVQALNDDAKNSVVGDMMEAAKNSNKNAQFMIAADDVEAVNVPVGHGEYGQFMLKPEVAKKYGEEGWKLPSADNPDVLVTVAPGQSYAFKTRAKSPFDSLFNDFIIDHPYDYPYKGYTIKVVKSSLKDGIVTATLFDPKGNQVEEAQRVTSGMDAKQAIEAYKRVIEALNNK
jgi:hypothetical protein